MGQRLRVVGWLRFGSRAQRTKGLRAFARGEAPGYFEADAWEIENLDARVRIDVELPGDFAQPWRPFADIALAAAHGYVDVFEEGVGEPGRARRWSSGKASTGPRSFPPGGTSSYPLAARASRIPLGGRLRYASEEACAAALEEMPFRLSYLTEEGAMELRLGNDVLRRSGAELSVGGIVEGPSDALLDPLLELFSALASKTSEGELGAKGRVVAAGKAPRVCWGTAAGEGPVLRPVEANSRALAGTSPAGPARGDAEGASSSSRSRKGAGAGGGSSVGLAGHPGAVLGACALPEERFAVWGGSHVTFYEADLSPAHALSTEGPFSVMGVAALPGNRALVLHEMDGGVEIVDLARREHRARCLHESEVSGALALDDRFLTWSLDGTARLSSLDGELLFSVRAVPDLGVAKVLVPGDGTFVALGTDGAGRFSLETGEKVEDLGERSDAHPLSGGRYLLESFGVFELRGAGKSVSFVLDEGSSHGVAELGPDEVLVYPRSSRRAFALVSLEDGSARLVASAHTKDLGAFVHVEGDLWVSHARSIPGLNERFGFDGTLRVWRAGAWEALASWDAKAPIRRVLPLGGGRVALLLDDAARGKEVPVFDVARGRLASTLRGHKKTVLGALPLSAGKLLTWSKGGQALVTSI